MKFLICFQHHNGVVQIEARDLTQAKRIASRRYGKHGYRSVYAV